MCSLECGCFVISSVEDSCHAWCKHSDYSVLVRIRFDQAKERAVGMKVCTTGSFEPVGAVVGEHHAVYDTEKECFAIV